MPSVLSAKVFSSGMVKSFQVQILGGDGGIVDLRSESHCK
jgi:hypothetical protein